MEAFLAALAIATPAPACRTGARGPAGGNLGGTQPGRCRGEVQKKLLEMSADLQKMGDQDYKVEITGDDASGVTIYTRTMPRAVRLYLTASHVETVPEVQQANHRGYYQIRPRPNAGCGLDYQVRFVSP
jgi:hypothetical protein